MSQKVSLQRRTLPRKQSLKATKHHGQKSMAMHDADWRQCWTVPREVLYSVDRALERALQ
jgi:hypothetical protein